jgi:predicted transcriptional regulator YheO
MPPKCPSPDQKGAIAFTNEDRGVIKSFEALVPGLAELIGPHCEIVLHSLEDLRRSVVCIANGHITGRGLGSPITDLALDMLGEIRRGGDLHKTYFSTTRDGRRMKSCTTAIRNTKGRIIGLLCVNICLDVPFATLAAAYTPPTDEVNVASKEFFATSITELLESTVNAVLQQVNADPSIPPSQKNKQIVVTLFDKGVFEIKDAIQYVAGRLGVTKHVVYLHIRNHKGDPDSECADEQNA